MEKVSIKNDFSIFGLSTKADILLLLKSRLSTAKVENISIITVSDVINNFDEIYKKVLFAHKGHKVAVRSSSKFEDGFKESNAGHFKSVLDVDIENENEFKEAIEKVIDTYKKNRKLEDNEQILIQDMTEDVRISGVVLSRDIQDNGPYYVLNYDDSGSTNSVTGGIVGKTILVLRSIDFKLIPLEWGKLFNVIYELENIFNNMLLDIEFAIKESGEIIIFQVRPLAASYRLGINDNDNEIFDLHKNLVDEYLNFSNVNNPYFSDMSFWNPAEMIGDNPRPLDYSLYKYIITSKAWNEGIAAIGYRTISKDLMYQFGNKPYILVDYAFESLIPKTISNDLSKKLIKYYKMKLKNKPEVHDKIEFEIVYSCFDFSVSSKISELLENGFSNEEVNILINSLQNLTNDIIKNYKKILQEDTEDLAKLEEKRIRTENIISNLSLDIYALVEQIKELLDSIYKFGAVQFARQARCAFIAKAVCEGLVNNKYISKENYKLIMDSIITVPEKFRDDMRRFYEGELSYDFIKKQYGHLRAGTYDIRIPRYDQTDIFDNINSDFSKNIKLNKNVKVNEDLKNIENDIFLPNVDYNIGDLIYFVKNSIEQRENFKFVFSRSLSRCIECIILLGEKIGISKNDLSYVNITEICSIDNHETIDEIKNKFINIIEKRKKDYLVKSELKLPQCIFDKIDFEWIKVGDSLPNFITNKIVHAEIVNLNDNKNFNLKNKIVVLEKADPGYDWIFMEQIAGLITKYGGVASHMAIRCAEFSIPAAIGCGEKIYNMVCKKTEITLDCENNILR